MKCATIRCWHFCQIYETSRYKSIVTSGCVIGKIDGKEISANYNRSLEKI